MMILNIYLLTCCRPVRQSILRCLMCFEVAGVHHDINSVKGSKVSAFFENVAEDLRPEGLPYATSDDDQNKLA